SSSLLVWVIMRRWPLSRKRRLLHRGAVQQLGNHGRARLVHKEDEVVVTGGGRNPDLMDERRTAGASQIDAVHAIGGREVADQDRLRGMRCPLGPAGQAGRRRRLRGSLVLVATLHVEQRE